MLFRHFQICLLGLLSLSFVSCLSVGELTSLEVSHQTPAKKKPPVSGSSAHVICWNVHKASDETFKKDVSTLLEKIPRDKGLTLCFQEVRGTTFEFIKGLHREDVSGHYAPSWRLPWSKKSTGVLTIGNRPLPASAAVPIKAPRRELYVASPKVSLKTETLLPDGRSLKIVNCHGLNFVPFSALPKQLDQVFDSIKDSHSPAIVCGDFNVWSEQRLGLLNQRAAEAGLVEAHPRGLVHSPAPKWLRWMHRFNGFDPELRLDRIYTRGIEVIDCYSHPELSSSDHLPIVLSYKVLPSP